METTESPTVDYFGTINSTSVAENVTSVDVPYSIPISRIVVAIILFSCTATTFFGNLIVLLAFAVEKKLRTNFGIYIFNLALTDFAVSVTAMFFYSFDILLGYWPFGEFMCGVWIFFDYGMTFASVFTLVAISIDRFWSVKWSIHYRTHNSKKKTLIACVIVWMAVLSLWLAPCIMDRIKWSEPNVCIWEPSKNPEFVVLVATLGHHGPCLALVFSYIYVFAIMQSRRNLFKTKQVAPAEGSTMVTAVSNTANVTSAGTGQANGSTDTATKKDKVKNVDKEKKIFITLSYIIFFYLFCWVPFHIIFDVSSFRPELVSDIVYAAAFYLTYLNSMVNPFLYAYSSKDFRNAFIKVITCRCV